MPISRSKRPLLGLTLLAALLLPGLSACISPPNKAPVEERKPARPVAKPGVAPEPTTGDWYADTHLAQDPRTIRCRRGKEAPRRKVGGRFALNVFCAATEPELC